VFVSLIPERLALRGHPEERSERRRPISLS